MEKQKTREEIDNKYKWDLTTIYKTDEEFLNDLENIDKEINKREKRQKENPETEVSGFCTALKQNQRLLNCGARRAALRPYFLRSFMRGSRVSRPAFLRAGRSSPSLYCRRARAIP